MLFFGWNLKIEIISSLIFFCYRNHETAIDLEKLRKREKKWLHMLTNWSYFMDNKYEKVRKRCRKGIPSSLRGRAWKHLCGAAFHMEFSVNKRVFEVNNLFVFLLCDC